MVALCPPSNTDAAERACSKYKYLRKLQFFSAAQRSSGRTESHWNIWLRKFSDRSTTGSPAASNKLLSARNREHFRELWIVRLRCDYAG